MRLWMWGDRGHDSKESCFGIGVIEHVTLFDPMVFVQNRGVEPRVHAFTGPAGGEGPTAAHEGV